MRKARIKSEGGIETNSCTLTQEGWREKEGERRRWRRKGGEEMLGEKEEMEGKGRGGRGNWRGKRKEKGKGEGGREKEEGRLTTKSSGDEDSEKEDCSLFGLAVATDNQCLCCTIEGGPRVLICGTGTQSHIHTQQKVCVCVFTTLHTNGVTSFV